MPTPQKPNKSDDDEALTLTLDGNNVDGDNDIYTNLSAEEIARRIDEDDKKRAAQQ